MILSKHVERVWKEKSWIIIMTPKDLATAHGIMVYDYTNLTDLVLIFSVYTVLNIM